MSSLRTNPRAYSGTIMLTSHVPTGNTHVWSREGRESEGLGRLGNGVGPLSHPMPPASILPRSDQTGDQLPHDDALMRLWKPAASGPFLGDICQDLESL